MITQVVFTNTCATWLTGTDITNLVQDFLTKRFHQKELITPLQFLSQRKVMSNMSLILRLIRLCNVVYKIISKVLTNKLKCHSTQLQDHTKVSLNSVVGLKLDMAKACYRMEWDFLEANLKAFGFLVKFIRIFAECFSSFS